jgi:hypothetical protein
MGNGDDHIAFHEIIQADLNSFDSLLVRLLADHYGFEPVLHLALPCCDCCQTKGITVLVQQKSQQQAALSSTRNSATSILAVKRVLECALQRRPKGAGG